MDDMITALSSTATQAENTDSDARFLLKKLSPLAKKRPYKPYTYRIKLEQQNNILLNQINSLNHALSNYVNLYEFAPIGYLVIHTDGRIENTNLIAAMQLGIERKPLQSHHFVSFVDTNFRDSWNSHFHNVISCEDKLSCELALQNNNVPSLYVHLDCRCIKNAGMPPVVGITLTDISEHKRIETNLSKQINELKRFNNVMMGREKRILELKHEVNQMAVQNGLQPRYPSA